MIAVYLESWRDAARLVDGMLEAAELAEQGGRSQLARAYRELADKFGDAVDALPDPSAWRAEFEQARVRHAESMAGVRLEVWT